MCTKNKKGRLDRRQPGIAVLSFNTGQEALTAVDEKQGCTIHGRKVSVMFSPRKLKRYGNDLFVLIFSELIGLTVYGLKKSTTETEVQSLFPQANRIEMHPLGGFAILYYNLVDDCKLDKKNASGAQFKDRKLRVVFKYKSDVTQNKQASPTKTKPSTSLLFVKNLGRSTTEAQVSGHFKGSRVLRMPMKGKACRG